MKLREALERIQEARPAKTGRERYLLACSSTSSHLQTFLNAFLCIQKPEFNIEVEGSLYGDLLGSLETVQIERFVAVALVWEWHDLDPRLGFRRLGGWGPSVFDDVAMTVQASITRLQRAIDRIACALPVVVALPGLPLPPLDISVTAQALRMETRLSAAVWNFAEWCVSRRGVRLVSNAALDLHSPLSERFDLRTELSQGCPYRLTHLSVLAELMSRLLAPAAPLKGLITDLDDTLWRGILGEVGADGVCFTLDTGAQLHGLYQQTLQSLAERGVLLGVASKNDLSLVERVLTGDRLLVSRNSFFPVEANWRPKSESVARILEAWNLAPESVAFIDDSPLEAAEVQSRFPQIRCLTFPTNEPARFMLFLNTLRDWFGRPTIRDEDSIRTHSVHQNALANAVSCASISQEEFLAGLDASLRFRLSHHTDDERAFELVNKTNQFNLNGRRITEAAWREALQRSETFLVTATYADRFGPLGKIGVALGQLHDRAATISSLVLSCRAFSRRIEYATLRYLFDRLEVDRILFEFEFTERNGPLREFFASLGIDEKAPEISRPEFDARCPLLSHAWEELAAHV